MNNSTSCELSIVMPCLNEAETLEICIKKAKQFFQTAGISGEVLIADNGSTDGSQQIAEENGARVVSIPTKGYGSALIGGIQAAQGKYIIMGDADDSYDFSSLSAFVEKLREGYELVMGNRFKGGIMPNAMPPLHRYLGNPVLSGIGRLFFKTPIGDFHCGLRGFSKEAILKLDLHTSGMEFASEMVVKATLHKLKITEVPTILHKDGRSRPPHLRSWRDGWRHLRFLLMYSPRWLFLYPGIFMILLGVITTVLLLPAPLVIRGVTFDIHTLLLANIAIILGSQIVAFAILAKQYAIKHKLLPQRQNFVSFLDSVSLEMFLISGLLFIMIGLSGIVYSVLIWGSHNFGALSTENMMRLLVPSVTFLAVGFQIMFASFFKSIIDLKTV